MNIIESEPNPQVSQTPGHEKGQQNSIVSNKTWLVDTEPLHHSWDFIPVGKFVKRPSEIAGLLRPRLVCLDGQSFVTARCAHNQIKYVTKLPILRDSVPCMYGNYYKHERLKYTCREKTDREDEDKQFKCSCDLLFCESRYVSRYPLKWNRVFKSRWTKTES